MSKILFKTFIALMLLWQSFWMISDALSQSVKIEEEFGFAHKLLQDKLYELAGEQFRAFAKKYPAHEKSDDALFLSGNAFFDGGKIEDAFESYKQLEIGFPQSEWLPPARFRLAQCVLQQKKFSEAAELFKRLAVFHPESEWAAKGYLEAGRAYLKAGALKLARDSFLTLIQIYPEAVECLDAHFELIDSYFQNNEYQAALAQIDGVVRSYGADFKDVRVYLLRAHIYNKLGQTAEAESIYLKLLNDFPNAQRAQQANFYLGELYFHRRLSDAALTYLDKFLAGRAEPSLAPQAFFVKAEALLSLGRFEEAFRNYQEAARLLDEPEKSTALIKAARAANQAGQSQSAIQILEALISKKDSSFAGEDGYRELVEAYIHSQRYHDAITFIQRFFSEFPQSPLCSELLFKKAEIYQRYLNDYAKALRAFSNFVERFPVHPEVDEAQLALAYCYQRLGEYRLAFQELSNYLSSYPAGDNYALAKRRSEMIAETIAFDPPKLSLVSKLLKSAQSKDEIAWHVELGKAYFQAKDFESALGEWRSVLQLATDSETKNESYYRLGQCYFLMAEKSFLQARTAQSLSYLDSAGVSLNFLINQADSTQWLDDAFFLLTRVEELRSELSLNDHSMRTEIFRNWEARLPASKFADLIVIRRVEEFFAAAENARASLEDALRYYQKILARGQASPFYEEAAFKEALTFSKLGADSIAIQRLNDFIERFPKGPFSADALLLKAKLDAKNKNFDSAIAHLQRLISEFYYSPLTKLAQKELADIYVAIGDFQSALDGYRKLQLLRSPNDGANGVAGVSDVSFYEGRANENLGQWEAALAGYLDFIHHHPGHANIPEALLAVARITQKQNNLALAREFYQKLLTHHPQPAYQRQSHVALGDIFFNQNLYNDAFDHYSTATKLADNLSNEEYPASQAVRCRYKLRQFAAADSEAEAFRKKFKSAKSAEAQFLIDKGHALIAEKSFDLAEKTFKKLKSDFKGDEAAEGEFGLGAVYLITNHIEDALKILTDIPSKYPESRVTPASYFNLGDFYYKSQQLENAISAFKKVLTHPQSGTFHQSALRYLIKCYSDAQWWDVAIVAIRDYLDAYPYSDDAFNMKIESARLLMNLREYPRAIESFQLLQPFAAPESQAEIQFYIAQCYREMGNFNRAVAEYLRVKYLTAPTKLPWHVTALFEASKCLVSLGEIEQAKTILKQIISSEGMGSNFGRFAAKKLEELQREQSANR
jgi:TolA-binding protein